MNSLISKKGAIVPEPERDEKNIPYITHDYLVKLCESQGQYRTPHLNDRLYLASKGFRDIRALDAYTNIKALYLNDNIINRIQNIGHLSQLKCLFLQNNQISKIEGLDALCNIETLNLSHNSIETIENLEGLKQLSNLDLSSNKISERSQVASLRLNSKLSTLNLSMNSIEEGEQQLLADLKGIASLKVIYLKQNGIVPKIKNYRKRMLVEFPNLTYIDDRPVAQHERRLAQAFILKGSEGEAEEREVIRKENSKQHQAYLTEINESRNRTLQNRISTLKKSKQRLEDEISVLEAEKAKLDHEIAAIDKLVYEKMTLGQLSLEENERHADEMTAKKAKIGVMLKEIQANKYQIGHYEHAIEHASDPQNFDTGAQQVRAHPPLPNHGADDLARQLQAIHDLSTEPDTHSQLDSQTLISHSGVPSEQLDESLISNHESTVENSSRPFPKFIETEVERVLEESLFDFGKAVLLLKELHPEHFGADFTPGDLGKYWSNVECSRSQSSSIAQLETLD